MSNARRKRLGSYFRREYENLLAENSQRHGRSIPTSVERYFVSLTGYEYVHAIRRLVGDAHRVLVVGDGGARDYYSLSMLGKDVSVVDIAPQRHIPNLVIADITRRLPFPDRHFDAVVMAEVIEHLFDDVAALESVRATLKEDGALILTVPFMNDEPEFHARVHTPKTVQRLLLHSGWRITDWETKGGGFAWLDTLLVLRLIKHAVNYLSWRLAGRIWYEEVNARLAAIDRHWGSQKGRVHRLSPYYGVFLRAVKAERVDYKAINVEEFTDYLT